MNHARCVDKVDDTSFTGGFSNMCKRHPSDIERYQAARLFSLLKDIFPKCIVKKSIKWKEQDEGRILLTFVPCGTFSPDPSKSENYTLERELRGCKSFTDYGLRMDILVPSLEHPHFQIDLEIVGLEAKQQVREHIVHKVTPAQFLAQTGCQYGFELAKKTLKIPSDTKLSKVLEEVQALIKKEFCEITTLLVFDNFAHPNSMISSNRDIESFFQELIEEGLKVEEVPYWLKMPFKMIKDERFSNRIHLYFDTNFEGYMENSSHSRIMSFQNNITICGILKMRIENDRLLLTVRAKPTMRHNVSDAANSTCTFGELRERNRVVSRVTSKEGLSQLILKFIEEVVFYLYRRSNGWSRPVFWKQKLFN
jgi:hypothetical protein